MIKKFLAGAALVGMLALPVGCIKSQFIATTDKINRAAVTINMAYYILEAQLEKALEKDLPDAKVIAGYLTVLESIRDQVANLLPEEADQAEAAAMVADQLVEQAQEVVE